MGRRSSTHPTPEEVEAAFAGAMDRYGRAVGAEANAVCWRELIEIADASGSIDNHVLESRARTYAAEAAYFARGDSTADARAVDGWSRRAVSGLIEAATVLPDRANAVPGYAEVVARLSDDLMGVVRVGEEAVVWDRDFSHLAAAIESHVPPEYDFSLEPQSRWSGIRALARLSHRYGTAGGAQARLVAGMIAADQERDVDAWLDLGTALYRLIRDHRLAPGQEFGGLDAIRNTLHARTDEFRARFRSRGARLWGAQKMEELFGEMLHDVFLEERALAPEWVLAMIESLKARTLLDFLVHSDNPLTGTEGRAALALERKLTRFAEDRLPADVSRSLFQEMRLVSRLPIGSPWDRSERRQILNSVERLYGRHQAGIRDVAKTATLRQVQDALLPGEVLIEYLVFPRELEQQPVSDMWILVVTPERAEMLPGIRFADAPDANSSTTFFDGGAPFEASPLNNEIVTMRVAIENGDDELATEGLSHLYGLLIQHVVNAGFSPQDAARWIIVPSGALHPLPFAALVGPDGRHLIEHVPISLAASSSVLCQLRLGASPRLRSFVALIDPDLASRPRLAEGEAEIAAVKRALARLEGEILTGAAATEANFRQLAAGKTLVHLTSHGEFPETDAIDFHRVLLAESAGDDGRLTAEEIRQLNLRETHLFMLNVCDAGLYRVGPGDEPYGLVPALLMAGARNVLATLWPVEHEISRHFITAIYDELLEGPAEALRAAAVSFIEDEALIRHWAGFVLSGSAQPMR